MYTLFNFRVTKFSSQCQSTKCFPTIFRLICYFEYIHTYIIGHYNPSVRIIDLTPLMLCVLILYISGGTYSLKSTTNDRFFLRNFSWLFYLLLEFLSEIC